ncbi:putative cysteine desulfurase [Cercophora samala]|uniref:Cysteine desulfurase n=1 Tax=Cercophora samala TaxID=330535 RepID=A0AA40DCE7_9PEZI|nr:putative cysteine desulfurase [Cercophora samala]
MAPDVPRHMDNVRASFPALSGDHVFFDNAAGTQVLRSVADRVRDYLLTPNLVNDGYQAAANFINASPDEIVFGSSATQLLRNLSHALSFSPGDEIVLCPLDHESNIAPWIALAARQTLQIKWWHPHLPTPSSTNPTLDFSSPPPISPLTRLLCLTHTTNILGTIHPIKLLSAQIRSLNPRTLLCVDGVAYAPHRQIDVQDLGVDFYVFSWYKLFGPRISQLYASPRARSQLQPMGHFFNPAESLDDKVGLAGGWCQELIYGIPAVVEYLTPRWDRIVDQEERLQSALLGCLGEWREEVLVYGEWGGGAGARVPTVSFRVKGWKSRDVVEAVERETDGKVKMRWGTFYSVRLAKEVLGLDDEDGVVRVSLVHYNTVKEVRLFYNALLKVLGHKESVDGMEKSISKI